MINFDAHFDLLPLNSKTRGTSGTPFFQIHQYGHPQQLSFDYYCLGIQPLANTKSLFHHADEFNVSYLTAELINKKTFARQTAFLDEFLLRHDHIYLTICLDVFADSVAPGVSAPQILGLTPWQVLPLLKYIAQTGKVVRIDVAELSPPMDLNHQTSCLAAAIVTKLLNIN
jgi:formiminoglutamase